MGTLISLQIGNLVSVAQPFGLSLKEFGFEDVPFDGILGLGYPRRTVTGATPIFDNLWKQSRGGNKTIIETQGQCD